MTHDCKACHNALPDLLFEGGPAPAAVRQHLSECASCRNELTELRSTFALMDAWTAPEPGPYFDTKLHARLREAQASAPEGLWERLTSFVSYSTGRGLRPALAGALGLAMLVGGGTAATVILHHGVAVTSPTVNDLKIYDNNAQAVQQMDMLDESSGTDDPPQT